MKIKKILAGFVGFSMVAAIALAGLDTTGLRYTTLADNVLVGSGSATVYSGYVDVSALKGNAEILLVDSAFTSSTGTVTYVLLTGTTTNLCTNIVDSSVISLTTGGTNTSAVASDGFNTEDVSTYMRLQATCTVTTTVRRASSVIVSY